MQQRFFTFTDSDSNKYWEIQYWNKGFRSFWGKIGTTGRFNQQDFENEDECKKEIENLIASKVKKGYLEVTESNRLLEADILAEIQEFEQQNEIKVHSLAKKMMNEKFIWSCVEETSPFGSDDGSDTFAEYKDWIEENPRGKSLEFANYIIEGWFGEDINQLKLSSLIEADFDSNVIHIDTAIITTAFSQLVLKGKIDVDILGLAKICLERQLLPTCLHEYANDYQATRVLHLNKLLSILKTYAP